MASPAAAPFRDGRPMTHLRKSPWPLATIPTRRRMRTASSTPSCFRTPSLSSMSHSVGHTPKIQPHWTVIRRGNHSPRHPEEDLRPPRLSPAPDNYKESQPFPRTAEHENANCDEPAIKCNRNSIGTKICH